MQVLFADSYRSVHHYDKESAQTKLSVLKFHDGSIVRMHNKAGLNETYARTNRLAAAGHFNEAIEELKKACELGLDFITVVDEDEPLATLRRERPYAWRELEESISAGVRPPEDGGAQKDGHLSVGQAKAFALELLALPNDAADTEVDKLIRKIRAPPAPAQDGALPVRSKPFTDPWGLHQLPFGSQDSIPNEDQGGCGSHDLPIVMC